MPFPFPSASLSASPEEVWTAAFEKLSQQIRHSFRQPETHQHATTYVQGLMSDVSRKKRGQVAEAMGEGTPYATQHLFDRAKWDPDEVRETLASSDAVFKLTQIVKTRKSQVLRCALLS